MFPYAVYRRGIKNRDALAGGNVASFLINTTGLSEPWVPPDFDRSVNPISTGERGHYMPTTLLILPSPRIFRPSYGPRNKKNVWGTVSRNGSPALFLQRNSTGSCSNINYNILRHQGVKFLCSLAQMLFTLHY